MRFIKHGVGFGLDPVKPRLDPGVALIQPLLKHRVQLHQLAHSKQVGGGDVLVEDEGGVAEEVGVQVVDDFSHAFPTSFDFALVHWDPLGSGDDQLLGQSERGAINWCSCRQRMRDRQTDRRTESREADTKTERHADRQTDRHRDRDKEIETVKKTHT